MSSFKMVTVRLMPRWIICRCSWFDGCFTGLVWPLLDSPRSHDWEDVSPWKDLGCERKLNCRTPGQRAVTWKYQGHTDVYFCFPRVSSTGTVSCLYPLNHPSLLSFTNLGAEDELIYVLDMKSKRLIYRLHCAVCMVLI